MTVDGPEVDPDGFVTPGCQMEVDRIVIVAGVVGFVVNGPKSALLSQN